MKNKTERIKSFILLLFVCFVTVFGSLPKTVFAASDGSLLGAYKKISVYDDLFHDNAFDKNLYKSKEMSSEYNFEIMTFVEFGYKADNTDNSDYGLFVYIYNPKLTDIDVFSEKNEVLLAVSGQDLPYTDESLDYHSYSLEFCNAAGHGTEDTELFLKFMVVDPSGYILSVLNNSAVRKYFVAEVELFCGGNNAVTDDFAVGLDQNLKDLLSEYGSKKSYGKSFLYKGYGKDLSTDNGDSLNVESEVFQTLYLEPTKTWYRGEYNEETGYQDQIDSVYFAVPNSFFDEDGYGELSKVSAEYREFKTKPILIADNKEKIKNSGMTVYDLLINARNYRNYSFFVQDNGSDRGDGFYDLDYTDINQFTIYSDLDSVLYGTSICANYIYGFNNVDPRYPLANAILDKEFDATNTLDPLIVFGKDLSDVHGYDVVVGGDELQDYLKQAVREARGKRYFYPDESNKSNKSNKSNIYEGFFDSSSKGLSEKTVIDYDVNEKISENFVFTYDNPNWWQRLWGGKPEVSESGAVSMIEIFNGAENLNGKSFSALTDQDLCIQNADINAFKTAVTENKMNDQRTVLLRIGASKYWSDSMVFQPYPPTVFGGDRLTDKCIICTQTVYLDFDILSLTFKKDGVNTVIPVAMSPIDVIADLTAPAGFNEESVWDKIVRILKIVLFVIVLMFLCWLLSPILPYVLKVLWFVITLPFRLIAGLFRLLKGK